MMRILSFFLLFSVWSLIGYAQKPMEMPSKQAKNRSIKDSLQAVIGYYAPLINSNMHANPFSISLSSSSLTEWFDEVPKDLETSDIESIKKERQLLDMQQKLLKKDYGLSLHAGYLQNLKAGIFSKGEIFYNRRGRMGVTWNVLKNGFLEHKHKANLLQSEETKLSESFNEKQTQQDYAFRYNIFIYYFNKKRIKLLKNYLQLQNKTIIAVSKLHEMHYISKDMVIDAITQKVRLQNKLKAYQQYNTQFKNSELENLSSSELPILDIRLDQLLKGATHYFMGKSSHQQVSSTKSYNPLYDIDLSLYGRYSLFGYEGNNAIPLPTEGFGGREYFSTGVNVAIPIPFNASEKRKIAQLKRTIATNKQVDGFRGWEKELYNHYYEYEFTLQQFIQFYGKYLKNRENIRQQVALKKLKDWAYSPRKLVDFLQTGFESALALVDLKQKLYLKLLKIDQYTAKSVESYTYPAHLQQLNDTKYALEKDGHFQKGIYIWSSAFKQTTNKAIIQILKQYAISTVYLSFSDSQEMKAYDFVAQAHHAGIKVSLLVGNNQLIFVDTHLQKLEKYVVRAAQFGMDGIHLDVEPQVFDDWDEKKMQYKNDYVRLVKTAHQYTQADGLLLSVAIPHYFDDILKKVSIHVDRIVVMVYETNRVDQIISRTQKEVSMVKDHLIIALRPTDFGSLDKMKNAVKEISRQTKVKQFAFHDLAGFKKMILKKKMDEK